MNKNLLLLALSQIFSFTAAPVTVFLSGIIGSQISPLKSLKSIRAKTILMPCNQDLYFRTEDNKFENKFIPYSFLRPIDSSYGHCAANPGNDKNFERQLDKNIKELLS